MSISTLLGVLFGFGLFLSAVAVSADDWRMFFDVLSVLIVLGGTFASAFMGYQARYVLRGLRGLGTLFVRQRIERLTVETGKIIRWGYLVKKHGILALEREIKTARSQDPYLRYGVELVITG